MESIVSGTLRVFFFGDLTYKPDQEKTAGDFGAQIGWLPKSRKKKYRHPRIGCVCRWMIFRPS